MQEGPYGQKISLLKGQRSSRRPRKWNINEQSKDYYHGLIFFLKKTCASKKLINLQGLSGEKNIYRLDRIWLKLKYYII